ncbi:hypothetical protein C8F01DRAFT_1118890 [Mycena amicta]|nr:hypothetical protein C8F01DRAFT_1118890 [Mycena amicta]
MRFALLSVIALSLHRTAGFDLLGEFDKLVAPASDLLHHTGNDVAQFFSTAGKDVGALLKRVGGDFVAVSSNVEDKIGELKGLFDAIVGGTSALQDEIYKGQANKDELSAGLMKEFERRFAKVLEELIVMFPPPDHVPTHDQRKAAATEALHKFGMALTSACRHLGIADEGINSTWHTVIEPAVTSALVLIGDLAEQHPILVEGVLVLVLSQLLVVTFASISTEYWFLEVVGFGSKGPIKGSLAAWIQSVVFGPFIPKNSWFAALQKIAMTL